MVDEERKLISEKINNVELKVDGEKVNLSKNGLSEPSRKLTVLSVNNCGSCVVKRDSDGKKMRHEDELTKDSEILKVEDANIYEEMSRLRRDFTNLMKETDDAKKQSCQPQQQQPDNAEDRSHLIKDLETELKNARDALGVLKADRKRLKAEKFELLNQMKQLYGTIEEKEKELRTFIRSFEMRMRESEHTLRQVIAERDAYEREKWALLRHARDETERALQSNAQLALKDEAIRQLQHEVLMLRRRVALTEQRQESEDHYATVSDCMATVAVIARKDENTIYGSSSEKSKCLEKTVIVPVDNKGDGNQCSTSVTHSSDAGESGQPSHLASSESCRSSSSGLGNHSGNDEDSTGNRLVSDPEDKSEKSQIPRSGERRSSKGASGSSSHPQRPKSLHAPSRGPSPWGSISKVFTRKNPRKSLEVFGSEDDRRSSWSPQESLCATPLREESIKEKLLEEVWKQPIENWKSATVLTWMDCILGMGQYIPRCAENLKSGKILLDLNESEYESGLGISHPMHRKKLRLAVEERRNLPVGENSVFDQLSTTWVVEEWLQDIGLQQYSETFKASLVDGRLLDALTKKELEKHLGVAKKFHQTSVIHAITLLKLLKFEKKVLQERRDVSRSSDCDPIVWTNKRIIEWIRSIDLGEYADSLKESGVHGALMVLESSFTAETLAAILGIPPSRNIVRRHLVKEFDGLVQVARVRYQQRAKEMKAERRRNEKLSSGGSLGRAFSKSFSGGLSHVDTLKHQNEPHLSGLQKLTLRSSLHRGSGNRHKHDPRLNSTVPYISSPMSPVSPISIAPCYGFVPARPTSLVEDERPASEKHRRVRSSRDSDGVIITKI